MSLNIDPGWLRAMAEKEDGCILSAGGWVTRARQAERQIDPPIDQPIEQDPQEVAEDSLGDNSESLE